MSDQLSIRIFDVEHGACAILQSPDRQRIAMIDSGDNSTTGWRPSTYIKHTLGRSTLDCLFVTNADQDHLSDLNGLWERQISIETLYRNRSPNASILRKIKEMDGEPTDDIERFLEIHGDYTGPAPFTFNDVMGGATCKTFANSYPEFDDTNNLSLAVFIKRGWFKMLFPGDLEEAGWMKLLENPEFRQELAGTVVFVASHHGRESGYCEDIFRYFAPRAVVMSDDIIQYDTQEMSSTYRDKVHSDGVIVNPNTRRYVLTTRCDGDITFSVNPDGSFNVFITK